MEITFKCPHCEQELSVEGAGAGTEIECPTCNQQIVVPSPDPAQVGAAPASGPLPGSGQAIVNPMASSAAAKEDKHFTVPVHDHPAESLIAKPLRPLEATAKEGHKLRVKTIRHSDCVEVGKDHFDEMIMDTLNKIGEEHIVKLETFNYTHQDLATRAWVTDYGLFIVYRI